ncbi:MAG: MoaD/ThiS family protein [Deferrisomatales bacterium]
MEIQVKFIGIPGAIRAVGGKEVTARIDPPTLGGLLRQLEATYGAPLRKALLNPRGEVDQAIQILHNGTDFVARDALDLGLSEGDHVTFLMMMAGG